MHDEDKWRAAQISDVREIMHGINAAIRIYDRTDNLRADPRKQKRVAVRLRLGHGLRPDQPTGASAVFHVKLLTECFAEWIGNDARPDIRVAARRIWHDDTNRSRRPISRLGAKDSDKRGGPNNRPEDETNFPAITVHWDFASSVLPNL